MNTTDLLIRGMSDSGELRLFAINSTGIVEKARRIHNTSPVVTAALGRLLTAGAMMGSMMKAESDVLTLNINGDGPAGALCVTCDCNAHVKGFVQNPAVIIPAKPNGKLDVSGAIGHGVLNVIRDTGLKEPYNSSTELVSGEIAEDLTYYFATSEQTPSAVALGVLMDKKNFVRCAGGFIIQVMPGATEETIATLENNLKNISSVTSMLKEGLSLEEMLQKAMVGIPFKTTDEITPAFACDCNREKVERAIISIGKDEIMNMISEGKVIETSCRFCGKKYSFSIADLEKLVQ